MRSSSRCRRPRAGVVPDGQTPAAGDVQPGRHERFGSVVPVGGQADHEVEATAMVRTRWWSAIPLVVLAGCGSAGAAGDAAAPGTTSPSADWTMPTGVFRSDTPQDGLLELHVDVGRVQLYDVTDGAPDIAYNADCAADDPTTVTCTEGDGVRIVFAWSLTDDTLAL